MKCRLWKLSACIAALVLCITAFTPVFAQSMTRPDMVNFISEDGLADGTPVTVTVDSNNWVWIGSASIDKEGVGGLSVINRNRHIFSFNSSDGLAANAVNDITLDPKGNCIWIATSGGLSCWDSKTGKFNAYTSSNSDLKTSDINVVYVDSDGNRWIGSNGQGLYALRQGDNRIESVKSPFNKITCIKRDRKGRLWVGSFEGIAYREGTVWVSYEKAQSTLPDNKIFDVVEGPNGEIIAATKKGLAVFDGITWSVDETRNAQLPVKHTTSLLVDSKGNLWVGTWGGGAVLFDVRKQKAIVYNRKNSDIMDNQVASMAMDSAENVWLATARGVSHIIVNTIKVTPEVVTCTNENAFRWENRSSQPESEVTFINSLPVNRYGYVTWAYGAYFSSKDYDKVDPNVNLNWNIFDNRMINVTEKSPVREFLVSCSTEGKVTRHYKADRTIVYPWFEKLPPEMQIYLKPGSYIPCDDPDVISLAKSLVRNSSKGDMFRTAEDILFSKMFTVMPWDYSSSKEDDGAVITDPRTGNVRTAKEVISDKTGRDYSKNRLAVTLLRSVNIPARLVFENGKAVWGEAYINNWGWVPFDVSVPIYAQGDIMSRRLIFPMVPDQPDLGINWVTGASDDQKTISWTPQVESVYTRGKAVVDDLKAIEKLKTARFLVIRPASAEVVPNEAKMPVSKTLTLMVKHDGQYHNLRFYDQGGNVVKKIPITDYYKTMTATVDGKVKMTFIPSFMGEYLILRMFEWEVKD
jgi:transglutaminase-like putative cysteine protease